MADGDPFSFSAWVGPIDKVQTLQRQLRIYNSSGSKGDCGLLGPRILWNVRHLTRKLLNCSIITEFKLGRTWIGIKNPGLLAENQKIVCQQTIACSEK